MSSHRRSLLCSILLVVLGLAALPGASVARSVAPTATAAQSDNTGDDPSGDATDPTDATDPATDDTGDDTSTVDDSCAADDGSAGDPLTDDTADLPDTATDGTDSTGDLTDQGLPDDPGADSVDSSDGSDSSGDTTDDTTGDTTDTSCEDTSQPNDLGGGVSVDDVTSGDVGSLSSKGAFSETFDMPGPGTIDEQLTAPAGATGRSAQAARASWTVLGRAHKSVAKAGTVTVNVRLTGKGRRILRTAKKTLHLTLRTRIAVAGGKTVNRTQAVTVKPPKRPHRHKKH